STFQSSNGNLLALTSNLKAVSEKLRAGQGSLGALLNDPSYAEQIRGSLSHLQEAIATSEKMIAHLEDFSAHLNAGSGLGHQLSVDPTVFPRLQEAVSRLNDAAASASSSTAQLRTAGAGINDTHTPVGLLLHNESTADELDRTIKNLRLSSQELSDDLE